MANKKQPRIDAGDLTVGPNDASMPQPQQAADHSPTVQLEHAHWCAAQIAAGWSYGATFSEADRTDPRLVAWEMLGG